MTSKQWAVLRSLIMFPFPLTASERGDPLLYALIRCGLAVVTAHSREGCPIWIASDAGRAILRDLRPDEWRAIGADNWAPLSARLESTGPSPAPGGCARAAARDRASDAVKNLT
jgi:hypothetical protein